MYRRAISRTPKRRGSTHTCLPPGGERDTDPARSGDGPACKDMSMLFMLTRPVGTGTDHMWSTPRCAHHRLGTRRQTRCAPPRPPGSAVPVTGPAREFKPHTIGDEPTSNGMFGIGMPQTPSHRGRTSGNGGRCSHRPPRPNCRQAAGSTLSAPGNACPGGCLSTGLTDC